MTSNRRTCSPCTRRRYVPTSIARNSRSRLRHNAGVRCQAAAACRASAASVNCSPCSGRLSAACAHRAVARTGPALKSGELPSAAWKLLTDAAASDKTRDRSDAISALTVLGRSRKGAALVETLLVDKDESIRVLSAVSLGTMKTRSSIPALKKALDDNSPQVRFAAAEALWNLGDRSGREIFYAVLTGKFKTSPGLIKGHMNEAMKDMHDPKALALIGINQASGTFLGPFSMGVSIIEEYAKDSSAPVQAQVVQLLAADNTDDTVAQLKDALGDKNWAVRAAAARALATLGRTEEIPALGGMMQNDKQKPARLVAAAAVVCLSAIASRSAQRSSESPTSKPTGN